MGINCRDTILVSPICKLPKQKTCRVACPAGDACDASLLKKSLNVLDSSLKILQALFNTILLIPGHRHFSSIL